MKVIIHPSEVSGIVSAPASKSAMQRACALSLIHKGDTILKNPGQSNDDLAALDVIQRLGARVSKLENGDLLIKGKVHDKGEIILDCGESGLGLRMFTPIAALSKHKITITGSGSLMTRPMNFFDEVLPKLEVETISNNGKLPIIVKGPLTPAAISIDGSLSSQFLTGLMIAFASACDKEVIITVDNLKSKPYIDLTLALMKHFGWEVKHNLYKQFYFIPRIENNTDEVNYTIEGDWSGGAFLLVAGAIAGNITVKGLDMDSTQADKKIMEALRDSKASLFVVDGSIQVGRSNLEAFHFDATDCPDLFPPLVALASFCHGETILKGVSRLKHKESDRGATLQEEFSKMGVHITVNGDFMTITGQVSVKGCLVNSHHDHRIAMACAIAALRADSAMKIDHAEAINKSYPQFYNDLKAIKTTLENL